MDLQAVPTKPFRVSLLATYPCLLCGKTFDRKRYVKDHIRAAHVKTLKCEFCNYICTPRRKQRMVEHQMKKHDFPIPFRVHQARAAARAQVRQVETVPIRPFVAPPAVSMPVVPSCVIPETVPAVPPRVLSETVPAMPQSVRTETVTTSTCHDMDLETPETDEIELDFDTSLSFESDLMIDRPAPSCPTPAPEYFDPPTPCLDEHTPPQLPLFPELDLEGIAPFSPLRPDQSPLRDLVDQTEVVPEVASSTTSAPALCPEAELQAAVQSILPSSDMETAVGPVAQDSSPGHIADPEPCPLLSAPAPSDPAPVPMDVPSADILSEAMAQANIEVPETSNVEVQPNPEFEAIPLPPTGPADPRYFFYGAPSLEDDASPHARIIQNARERAIRGWRNHGYSVNFTPMYLFAIRKVESARLPDGTVYSLASFWLERDTSLL